MLQSYLDATARQTAFSVSANLQNFCSNLPQCKQLGWVVTSVRAIDWYTIMRSAQRKQLRWQLYLSGKRSANVRNSSRYVIFVSCFLSEQTARLLHCCKVTSVTVRLDASFRANSRPVHHLSVNWSADCILLVQIAQLVSWNCLISALTSQLAVQLGC
jgi:hypothetical protein